MTWFTALDTGVQTALIAAAATILAALIGGLFTLRAKRHESAAKTAQAPAHTQKTVIHQQASGKNVTQIGVQNNVGRRDADGDRH